MRKLLAAISLAFCTVSALASNIDGEWKGKFDTAYGAVQLAATYKATGDELSGSISLKIAGNQTKGAIANGTVDGNTFEYSYYAQGNSFTHKGQWINENEILTQSSSGYEFTLTPAASKISGTWKGSADSQYGLVRLTPVYSVSGKEISGEIGLSVAGNRMSIEIENGKVSGNTFAYSYRVQGTLISHEGTLVNDNEIMIDSSTGIEIRLTRAEE